MFDLKTDSNGNLYVEIAGTLTRSDWKDARVAYIPRGNDELRRPAIRLYNWSSTKGKGYGNVDIPLDAIEELKEAIDYLVEYHRGI